MLHILYNQAKKGSLQGGTSKPLCRYIVMLYLGKVFKRSRNSLAQISLFEYIYMRISEFSAMSQAYLSVAKRTLVHAAVRDYVSGCRLRKVFHSSPAS